MIRAEGRDALRFVWWNIKNEKFQDRRMKVHSFDKIDSPCCYIWTVNKCTTDRIMNVIDWVNEAISDNFFYIDEHLNSFNIKEEALEIWQSQSTSNNHEILDSSTSSQLSENTVNLELREICVERVQGFCDVPQIKVTNREVSLKKRGILNYKSSIFYNLGIFTPIY